MATMSIRTTRPLSTSLDVVLQIAGEVDAACVGDLRRAVESVLSFAGGPVVLDFGGSTFIDAAGLGTLVWFARRTGEAGRRGRLRNVSGRMQQLLDLTGVQRCFDTAVPA